MDLFGGADDISSGSDGEDKPPTPGQPIVSRFDFWNNERAILLWNVEHWLSLIIFQGGEKKSNGIK